MAEYRLSAAAQADIIGILAWTHEHFGQSARKRYEVVGTSEQPSMGATGSWRDAPARLRRAWFGHSK